MKKLTKQQIAAARQAATPAEWSVQCPVRASLRVLGGKWKLLVLSYLFEGPRRYGELRRLMPEITEKMLIQELRELEADGIVARAVQQQVPPRVDYSLTARGQRVRPMFEQLVGWGTDYLGGGPVAAGAAAALALSR